MALKMSF